MGDISYCDKTDCPAEACERHPSNICNACLKGKGYVSVKSFAGECWRYNEEPPKNDFKE